MKMGTKILITILSLLAAAMTTGMNGGCSETAGTSTTYYYPNWMPDGRIIACKEEMTFTKNLWGTGVSDYHYYITALTIDSTNEVTKEENLFEIDRRVAGITCSPTGEMIAYITNTPSTRDIIIKNYSGQTLYEPASGAEYLDFSPDATKIVYTNGSREMYVTNIDGTNTTKISSEAYYVTWRNGNTIAFNTIFTISPDGTNQMFIVDGGNPQINNNAYIVYMKGTSTPGVKEIRKIKIDGSGDILLFGDYERISLNLSFNDNKIVGGDYRSAGITGIYVINIDGTGNKKLR